MRRLIRQSLLSKFTRVEVYAEDLALKMAASVPILRVTVCRLKLLLR